MKNILLFISIVIISVSCKKDKTPEIIPIPEGECIDIVSFSQTVEPIIVQSCATTGCHDATTHESGFYFSGYQNISIFIDPIIGSMRYDPGYTPMPSGSPKVADSLIQKIECWIAQGAQNN